MQAGVRFRRNRGERHVVRCGRILRQQLREPRQCWFLDSLCLHGSRGPSSQTTDTFGVHCSACSSRLSLRGKSRISHVIIPVGRLIRNIRVLVAAPARCPIRSSLPLTPLRCNVAEVVMHVGWRFRGGPGDSCELQRSKPNVGDKSNQHPRQEGPSRAVRGCHL